MQLACQLMAATSNERDRALQLVLAARSGGDAPVQGVPAARAAWLGLRLMQELFDRHKEARPEVGWWCEGGGGGGVSPRQLCG